MSKKLIDRVIKIILTLLALGSGITAIALRLNGNVFLYGLYGILYFVLAFCLWFENQKPWIRLVMIITLVTTLIITIIESILGLDSLGVNILLAAPGVLGLIYFNLNRTHNNSDLFTVFMKVILTFEVGVVTFMLMLALVLNGAMLEILPQWGKAIVVWGVMLLAILNIVYAVVNWLKFYRGKIVWITTISFVLELAICIPHLGLESATMIILAIIMFAVAILTAWMNNYIKK